MRLIWRMKDGSPVHEMTTEERIDLMAALEFAVTGEVGGPKNVDREAIGRRWELLRDFIEANP